MDKDILATLLNQNAEAEKVKENKSDFFDLGDDEESDDDYEKGYKNGYRQALKDIERK